MTETLNIDFSRPMAVFPLSECSLLPQNLLPLHVFEPRYRQMVRDVIDTHGLIAMGQFEGEVDSETYSAGRPPLRSMVCLGHVMEYERLDDDRYLMVLEGLCRCEIVREVEHEPYRLFLLRPVMPEDDEEEQLAGARREIEALVRDPSLNRIETVEHVREYALKSPSNASVIDVVAYTVCPQSDDRYAVLSEKDAVRRAEWLIQRLRLLRQAYQSTDPGE